MALPRLFSGLRGWILGDSEPRAASLTRRGRGLRIEPLECRALLSLTVSDAFISVTGDPSGDNDTYVTGDLITVTWDNSATGENTIDSEWVDSVTADLTQFGGEDAVSMMETEDGSNIWYTTFVLPSSEEVDVIDDICNVSVTALFNLYDFSEGEASGEDTSNLSVDNAAPFVSEDSIDLYNTITLTGDGSGTNGEFVAGDSITVAWNATADGNKDIVSARVDLSALGGGNDVAMSDADLDGIWTASLTLTSGNLDVIGVTVGLTAKDNAGYSTSETGADGTIVIDNISPTVSAENIHISGGSGPDGDFLVGDTLLLTWNNSASGDNNADEIDSVVVDLTQFGDDAANTLTEGSDGIWSIEIDVTTAILASDVNILVIVADDAGNTATTTYTGGPVVSSKYVAISSSGTGAVCVAGNTITATWDNSTATGDGTEDITGVVMNFSAFGGGLVTATLQNGIWTATYQIVSGSIDSAAATVSVIVTNSEGKTTTRTSGNSLSVDNKSPVVSNDNMTVSVGTGVGGIHIVGNTVLATWSASASGNTDIAQVAFNFAAFGGGLVTVTSDNGAGVWSASYTIVEGSIDSASDAVAITVTDDAGNQSSATLTTTLGVDNKSPTAASSNIDITSSGSGTNGAYIVGDTIVVAWNNTPATGDGNTDIAGVAFDFGAFGGGVVAATMQNGIWTAEFTITAGTAAASGCSVSAIITDDAGNKTTRSGADIVSFSSVVPTVTASNVSISSTTTGTVTVVGNVVTVTWDNTSSTGDGNANIASVAFDFTAMGGNVVTATSSASGIWSASYTIKAGTIDNDAAGVLLTVTNAAGNAASISTDAISVDNQIPSVTDAAISITSTGTGTGGAYIVGNTVTVAWNNTSTGDANGDITSVRVDFSEFGGGIVAASNSSGVWIASYTIVSGSTIADAVANVSVSATDDIGNVATTADTTGSIVDTVVPVVSSIKRTGAVNTASTTITFRVTFSEYVTGVDATAFTLTTTGTAAGTVSSVTAVSNSVYIVTVSDVSGDGTIKLNLIDKNKINDYMGNRLGGRYLYDGDYTNGEAYNVFDVTMPEVDSISLDADAATNAATVTYTVTFSEAVTGVDISDFVLAKTGTAAGTISSVTGSDDTYQVTVTGVSGDGALGLNLVDDDTIADVSLNPLGDVGNANGNFTGAAYAIDNTSPAIASIVADASPTNAAKITFTVTFNEAVTGLTKNNFSIALTNTEGAISSVTGSGAVWTVTVKDVTGDGTITVSLSSADGITDLAGNALSLGSQIVSGVCLIDTTLPTGTVTRTSSVVSTNASSVQFTVTMSEAVEALQAADFQLTTTGNLNASIASVVYSNGAYVVTVGVSGEGTVAITLLDDNITDLAGNPLVGNIAGNGAYAVDNVAPTATVYRVSSSIDGLSYAVVYSEGGDDSITTNADYLQFIVHFSENVTGVNASDFALVKTGTADGTITSVTGSGDAYTITVTGVSGNGTLALKVLNNDAATPVVDGFSNVLASTVTSPAFTIDNVVPTVTVSMTSNDASSGMVVYAIHFSEDVTGFTADDVTIGGNVDGDLGAALTGSGQDYVVTVAGMEGSGTVSVNVAAGVAKDSAGNLNTASSTLTTNYGGTTVGMFNKNSNKVYLKNTNTTGSADAIYTVSAKSTWVAFSGDWDGDGAATVGFYDPAASKFYLLNDDGTVYASFNYGAAGKGWKPIAGDWNGDGVDTVGLYNGASSTFYLRNTNASGKADVTFVYGPAGKGWTAIAGDWNGDGIDTVGLYNSTTSTFYLRNANSQGAANTTVAFGPAGKNWTPIVGDWNGNGVDTIGLYNGATSTFYLRNTNTKGSADTSFVYGAAGKGWTPIVGTWTASSAVDSSLATTNHTIGSANAAALTEGQLDAIIDEAIERWVGTGDLTTAQIAALQSTTFTIADISDAGLSAIANGIVYIDSNAASYGWFVDTTPSSDEEFTAGASNAPLTAKSTSSAIDHIDLLTVVEQALGQIAGLDDLADCIVNEQISPSVRSSLLSA